MLIYQISQNRMFITGYLTVLNKKSEFPNPLIQKHNINSAIAAICLNLQTSIITLFSVHWDDVETIIEGAH